MRREALPNGLFWFGVVAWAAAVAAWLVLRPMHGDEPIAAFLGLAILPMSLILAAVAWWIEPLGHAGFATGIAGIGIASTTGPEPPVQNVLLVAGLLAAAYVLLLHGRVLRDVPVAQGTAARGIATRALGRTVAVVALAGIGTWLWFNVPSWYSSQVSPRWAESQDVASSHVMAIMAVAGVLMATGVALWRSGFAVRGPNDGRRPQ